MACWGNTSQCCGDSNKISVFWVSPIPSASTTSGSATSTSSSPSGPDSTNQPPGQSSSTEGASSSSSSMPGATTATTPTTGSSQTNSSGIGESTTNHSYPLPGSASSMASSHSPPWPGNSSTSAFVSTTSSGVSTPGTYPNSTTLLPSSSGPPGIIISSSAMSGNASFSSASTTYTASSPFTTRENTHTPSPYPSTTPTESTVSATTTLPSTTDGLPQGPSSWTPVSPTYSFPTVPSSPFLPSSSTAAPAPSDAADVGLNKAIIAGAVIGAVAVLAVVGFGIWFLKKIRKQPDDDDISMVGMPREEDVPMGMRNGIRLVRGNND